MAAGRPSAKGKRGRARLEDLDWQEGTLRQVVRRLPGFGSQPAIVTLEGDEEASLSYEELAGWVEQLTAGLTAQGLGKGKRVAILASNDPGWIAACLAVINAGAVAVPLDATLDEEALRHVLADSAPDLAFIDGDKRERIIALASRPLKMIPLNGFASGTGSAELPGPEQTAALPEMQAEDPAVLFYTSGTTGPPKGVPLSHRNLLFELHSLLAIGLMQPGERLLLPLPLHHVYPFVTGMLAPLVYGVGIVLPQSMTGPHILQATRRCGVATVLGVPRLYEALVSALEGRVAASGAAARLLYRALKGLSLLARRQLSLPLGKLLFRPLHRRFGQQLQLMASGGAALDAELAWTMESLGWTVATGYGLTETSPLVTIVAPGDKHFHTAGKALPGVELRIVPLDADGENKAENEQPDPSSSAAPSAARVGEVQVRGPNVFAGYLNLPERSDEAFAEDGWYRTEDRGWIDEEGYLRLLGRAATFVVTSAGKNISLEELERSYQRHRLVKEVGIFLRDDRLAAVVVPAAGEFRDVGSDSPEQALHDAVKQVAHQLPRYKRIDALVVSRDALARTRLGKIRRDKLRQRFDTIRAQGEEAAETGPMAIEEMSGDDQALLEQAPAREAWGLLAERYPAIRLSPDSELSSDLGVDSLEWINLTLEIRDRTAIELSETATGRIECVRDLLQELLEADGRAQERGAALEEDPESYLGAEQKRWLRPLNSVEKAAAWLLYHINRFFVRAFFRVKASGLEHLREADQMVLTPNHTSVLDPFVIAAVVPYDILRRSAFAGWTGIAFANPLYRFVVRLARTLPMEHGRAAFSSLAITLVVIRRGMNVIWFPEGQRSPDGRLQKLMPGIGVLLTKQPLSAVPAVITGTFDAMPRGHLFPRPRPVAVRFGPACRPEQLDQEGQGEQPEARIADALHRKLQQLQEEDGA